LISGLLYREYKQRGRVRIGRFLIRRGLKIYPAFYFFTLVTLLVLGAGRFGWKRIAVESLFIQDYFRGMQVHTWSLGVEEQFYLFLAFLLVGLVHYNRVRWIPWLFGVVAVLSLGCRIAVVLRQGANQWAALLPAHERMDSLFFGVLISYVYWFHRETFMGIARGWWILPVTILCLLPWLTLNIDQSVWMISIGLTLNYVGFGCLLMWSLERPMARWLAPLALMGEYSYSIYLWHVAVREWLMKGLGLDSPSTLNFLIYIALAIAVGVILARLIEFPVLRLRERFMADPGAHQEQSVYALKD
jgi:peptidoglycan/LPS O-acetylase OafA/YrhL